MQGPCELLARLVRLSVLLDITPKHNFPSAALAYIRTFAGPMSRCTFVPPPPGPPSPAAPCVSPLSVQDVLYLAVPHAGGGESMAKKLEVSGWRVGGVVAGGVDDGCAPWCKSFLRS